MATAVVVNGTGEWLAPGQHKTTWANLVVNTTGDVGSAQGTFGRLPLLSVYVTGTMTSVSALDFEESAGATETWTVAQTVCGTNLKFDSTTGSNLATGTVYLVRPGGTYFRPHITAGASGAEDLTVHFVQAAG